MRINFVKKVKAKELIKEFERKYGNLEKLEKHLERYPDDYVALMDYEDWKHLVENPNIEIEEGEIFVLDESFSTLSKSFRSCASHSISNQRQKPTKEQDDYAES